jgi:hypothetical protein
MTFKPWQSWNPDWRPVWSRSVETLFRDAIAKIAKDQKVEDVERELVITLLAKAKKWDIKALEIYLDRLYWKPKQSMDVSSWWDKINSVNVVIHENK